MPACRWTRSLAQPHNSAHATTFHGRACKRDERRTMLRPQLVNSIHLCIYSPLRYTPPPNVVQRQGPLGQATLPRRGRKSSFVWKLRRGKSPHQSQERRRSQLPVPASAITRTRARAGRILGHPALYFDVIIDLTHAQLRPANQAARAQAQERDRDRGTRRAHAQPRAATPSRPISSHQRRQVSAY